jgi:hypothetical protein
MRSGKSILSPDFINLTSEEFKRRRTITKEKRYPIPSGNVLLAAILLAALLSFAQAPPGGEKPTCQHGNLADNAPSIVDAMSGFLRELQTALSKNDKVAIARMIEYPLSFASANEKFQVQSEQELVRKYDQISPKDLKSLLSKQRPECISRVGAKGFTVGTGQVWFDGFPDGRVRIFTVNAVLYRTDKDSPTCGRMK